MITTAELRRFLKAPNIQDALDDIDLLRVHAVGKIETALGRQVDGTGRTPIGEVGWPIIRAHNSDGGAATLTYTPARTRPALSTLPDYSTRYVPLVDGWIRLIALAWYKNRNPGATSESGGGVSVSYTNEPIPAEVAYDIQHLKRELGG